MKTRSWFRFAAAVGLLAAFGCDTNVNDGTVPTFEVLMLSRSSGGVPADNHSAFASTSHDGSLTVFSTPSTNLDPRDNNGTEDIYVRDSELHLTNLVSVNFAGTGAGNEDSFCPRISPDGRFVAFLSNATDLFPGGFDANSALDVYVRDLQTGTTVPVTVNFGGTGTAIFGAVSITANYTAPDVLFDGTYVFVAFTSFGLDLITPAPALLRSHVYVRRIPIATFGDPATGVNVLISQNFALEADSDSRAPSLGEDGTNLYVAFASNALNLDPTVLTARQNIFWKVVDKTLLTQVGSIQLVSINTFGTDGGNYPSDLPALSRNGRHVAFESEATDLIAGDANAAIDIYIRGDMISGPLTTEYVSVSSIGEQAETDSSLPSISSDGNLVAFDSLSSNLAPNDTNGYRDIFIRNVSLGTTVRKPLTFFGGITNQGSHAPSITGDGLSISFHSWATNLLPGVETNYVAQVYQQRLSP